MPLQVEYRRDKRHPAAWRSRTVDGEACEPLFKLIHAGRVGLCSNDVPIGGVNALKTASIPLELFTAGLIGGGMHRRIRIAAGWSYRIAEAVAYAD